MENKNPRRLAKEQHETSILDDVLTLLNTSKGTNFKITQRPEPPDGIASDGENHLWIELVDAFRSTDEAREQWTHAMSKKTPAIREMALIADPDRRLVRSIVEKKLGKLSKESYKPWIEKFGPGLLVISEQDPLFDEKTLRCLQEIIEDSSYMSYLQDSFPQPCFKEVYLRFRLSGWSRRGLVRIYPVWGPFICPLLE